MPDILIEVFDKIYNWARSDSLCPTFFASSCCGAGLMYSVCADYDIATFDSNFYAKSPRQADLLIVAGTITHKAAPELLHIYNQMAEPKYVIALGTCACNGGMYNNSYSVVYGVDKIIPVDIYLPVCPPKPEDLSEALMKLRQKIKSESITQRRLYIEAHKPKLVCKNYLDILTEENLN
ncbi:MAG: NADH-quinone oxidoreductase subunit B [Candidatus Gastranaerophilaceae bacterium]